MKQEFTESEIIKLKQLVCDHIDTKESDNSHRCTCCGNYHEKECLECHKMIKTYDGESCDKEHEESDDGYCSSCS